MVAGGTGFSAGRAGGVFGGGGRFGFGAGFGTGRGGTVGDVPGGWGLEAEWLENSSSSFYLI